MVVSFLIIVLIIVGLISGSDSDDRALYNQNKLKGNKTDFTGRYDKSYYNK